MSMSVPSTPAERRREKVRASILEAAEQVFAEEGEEGLSIRRLAEAIDYSPAAIYKYFGSKDELIDELKEAFFALILEEAAKLEDKPGPYSERARRCIGMYIRTALKKSHHYAAAFSGAMEGPLAGFDDFLSAKKGRAFMIVFDMVVEGQSLGVLRTDIDPSLSAKSIWASCHGLASLMMHLPHFPGFLPDDVDISREDFIAFHADQLMRGLELEPSKPQTTVQPGIRTL